jgi:hypothetical protein
MSCRCGIRGKKSFKEDKEVSSSSAASKGKKDK